MSKIVKKLKNLEKSQKNHFLNFFLSFTKNAILLILPFEEINIQPELSGC